MGLLTITNLEDGQDATANALNERFGKIVDVINGNIESQNLKNNAVTREKIAPGAVTSDKLSIKKSIDENGWTVFDYGTTKEWHRIHAGSITVPRDESREAAKIPLPAGVKDIDDVFIEYSVRRSEQGMDFYTTDYYQDSIKLNVHNSSTSQRTSNYVANFTIRPMD